MQLFYTAFDQEGSLTELDHIILCKKWITIRSIIIIIVLFRAYRQDDIIMLYLSSDVMNPGGVHRIEQNVYTTGV